MANWLGVFSNSLNYSLVKTWGYRNKAHAQWAKNIYFFRVGVFEKYVLIGDA
jgi:hypothetical protein